jgi:hypothetical protein
MPSKRFFFLGICKTVPSIYFIVAMTGFYYDCYGQNKIDGMIRFEILNFFLFLSRLDDLIVLILYRDAKNKKLFFGDL